MLNGPRNHSRREQSTRHVGLLSTYPPRMCGLATFTAALEAQLTLAGDRVTVVAIDDGRQPGMSSVRVAHTLVNGRPESLAETAEVLSRCDIAIVQHEFGIYGGTDGDEVVDVLRALVVPAIVVLHTVLVEPTPHQQFVMEVVCDLAARVVVMTATASARLAEAYAVDMSKVVMIAHGASLPSVARRREPGLDDGQRPDLLTWGLLGPGKGIEQVIRALALLDDLRPRLRYTVAGATHPNVLAHNGDQYRRSLIHEAWSTGVASSVTFDDAYRDLAQLMQLVTRTSLVVLPYDSRDQVTSGVLVDAIAAGRPVIATAFPHAVELLSDGAGIVVPQRDPVALAAAIRSAMTDPALLESMAARAREIAPSLSWSSVAAQYRDVCDSLSAVETAA